MVLRRLFAKFYNEIKTKPLNLPDELKKNLRNSTSVQIALRDSIKRFRAELPMHTLSEIVKASKAHLKAFYTIPNIVSPNDPKFEPGLRENLMKEMIDPEVKRQVEYQEDRLFMLDKSLEARRNYLLSKERDNVENAIRAYNEAKRIEELKIKGAKRFVPEAEQTELLLDGEINTQLVPIDTHTVLNPKGVVKLSSLPGKYPRFVDLTEQELANYICYNILNTEQGLQMFKNSIENENFHSNIRASLIQKLSLIKPENPKDFRLIELISSLKTEELSKKNLCNTIWAIGKIYETPPKSIGNTVESLKERFDEIIPICNSLNLAYACEGLRHIKDKNKKLGLKICSRFIDLMNSVVLPEVPINPEVPYLNFPPQGHSFFVGSKDLTIPTSKVPSIAIFKVIKYLENTGIDKYLPYVYKKTAQLINGLSLFEFDKNMLVEGIIVYGKLNEAMLCDKDIKGCLLKMTQLVLKQYDELTLKEVYKITEILMKTYSYHLSSWFKILELRSFEGIHSEQDPKIIENISRQFIRYYIAISYGRDISIEPFVWVYEKFTVFTPLLDKISEITKTRKIESVDRARLATILGISGYKISITKDKNFENIIAASIQGYPHESLDEIKTREELVEIVNSTRGLHEICELAAALAKHNCKTDWKYFEEFYENNKDIINSQPHRIALAWAIKKKVQVNYDWNLVTVTENRMLKEIQNIE
ncbi:hypothetical protein SteCoe_31260 [Stentor coeruleus]|uniref:Uncharacterized protein n=1 Tax=Stentor coeruleus TaxID=5963 RepID=A0A1R2B1S0_9CILI|nr:hypothetical protein SteCoe_31260 [Stentor coeruleus]